jgi:hypothetical protein
VAAEAAPEKTKAKVKVTTDFMVKLLKQRRLKSKVAVGAVAKTQPYRHMVLN